jgi:hypothetical protein
VFSEVSQRLEQLDILPLEEQQLGRAPQPAEASQNNDGSPSGVRCCDEFEGVRFGDVVTAFGGVRVLR